MNAYSIDLRQRVVAAKQAGESINAIAARFQVSPSTVKRHAHLASEGNLAPPKQPAPSLKRIINRPDVREVVRTFIIEHNDATLVECCDHLAERTGCRISDSAMCRLLQKLELRRKKTVHISLMRPVSMWRWREDMAERREDNAPLARCPKIGARTSR